MLDAAIVLALLLGTLAGWRGGFIVPFVAVATAALGLSLMYGGPGASVIPGGIVGLGLSLIVVALLGVVLGGFASMLASVFFRIGLLRVLDRVLGIPLGAATAALAVYLALTALVRFDNVLAPFHGKTTVDLAAITAVRAAAAADPAYGTVIGRATLDALAAQAAVGPVSWQQVARVDAGLAYYETDVRPQLLASVIAPVILTAGEQLPYVGRHVEYPTK